jgi:hypothetical protein
MVGLAASSNTCPPTTTTIATITTIGTSNSATGTGIE